MPQPRTSLIVALVIALVACTLGGGAELRWEQGAGFRSARVIPSTEGQVGFTRQPGRQTGVLFTNQLPPSRSLTNQMFLNGSGVAAGDMDGDGWCDLFFCNLTGRSALYRNLGNWRFEEVAGPAGVACVGVNATGAAFADLDGDGDLDLAVTSLGTGTRVFLNDGLGRFAEATARFGLRSSKGGASLALADIDGDGFLDLYVANYRTTALSDLPGTRFNLKMVQGQNVIDRVDGRPITSPDLTNRFRVNARGGIDENGEEDDFYRNQGGTNFARVSFTGGMFLDEAGNPLSEPPLDWGLSVMFRDINGDGWPDLYVCNDFDSPDRFWLNDGTGRFRAMPRLAWRKSSLFAMGVDFADINRDGYDDFFVLDMLSRHRALRMTSQPDRKLPMAVVGEMDNRPQYSRNTLFLNQGDATFAEIASLSGLEASEWSWGVVFLDVDLDGWEDVLITNGHERDARNMDAAEQLKSLRQKNKNLSRFEMLAARRVFPRLDAGNLAFRNRRDLTFEDTSHEWGFDFAGVSHGVALADLDNDGDLDVIVNNLNTEACLYRNNAALPRLGVRLRGKAPNTRGIGARIRVRGGPVEQAQEIISGGRYLSSDDPMRTFATRTSADPLNIEVTWRSGTVTVVPAAQPNRIYEIDESASVPRTTPSPRPPKPFFEDVSALLDHTHADEPFNDHTRQPLLPNRLSQLGPGVTWQDLDGDGWEDLIVGSGKGGKLAVFHNNGRGRFERRTEAPFSQPVTRDQTTVLAWNKGPGQVVLLAGSANYEDGLAVGGCVREYDPGGKTVGDALPGRVSSTGPLAMADIDGDGALDLFVGGRSVPERYPEPAASLLFRNVNGRLEEDTANSGPWAHLGLVSGAIFSDFDGDGDPDLFLACDWGPVRAFRNDKGRFTEVTEELGLAKFKGWWNGLAVGDFDNDGRLDIAASNWGRNSRYESHRSRPIELIYGDLDGDGTVDLVETYFDSELNKRVPERMFHDLAQAMPFLQERFTTHQAYSALSVEELFGERLRDAKKLEANWLESTVFLNRGNHFAARPLPVEAQMSPAFGICAGDFDGDGADDIFLGQNVFATNPETPRSDAGRGLWLRGDGTGHFVALSAQQSGIQIYGEQRGCALADFDHDGRLDLAVAQNGAQTKLYRNALGKPGLRVSLKGPPGNPTGIGAVLRVFGAAGASPAREIRAGSGYWSQDGAVQLFGISKPKRLQIRWPHRTASMFEWPEGAKEVRVGMDGKIELLTR